MIHSKEHSVLSTTSRSTPVTVIRKYLLVPLVILAGIFGPFFGVSQEERTKDISIFGPLNRLTIGISVAHAHNHGVHNTHGNTRVCNPKTEPYQIGNASWYGPRFHGRLMANQKPYNMHDYTVAHPHLPFGTRICIVNKNNGKTILATVTDRGPFAKGRILDLSKRIAEDLDVIDPGHAPVELHIVGRG